MSNPRHLEPINIPAGKAFVKGREVPIETERFDMRHVARLYNIPPWIVSGDYPAPRFPRLRWMLRRIWPV
jgi:hypothetical protein